MASCDEQIASLGVLVAKVRGPALNRLLQLTDAGDHHVQRRPQFSATAGAFESVSHMGADVLSQVGADFLADIDPLGSANFRLLPER